MDDFPSVDTIFLKRPTLKSIESVKYYDSDDVQQTWASSNYDVDLIAEPGYLKVTSANTSGYPSVYDKPNAVEIEYISGYGDAGSDVPEIVRAAIKFMISHLFENREGLVVSAAQAQQLPIPKSIDNLINMFSLREIF